MGAFYTFRMMVVIYVSSEGKKLYVKNYISLLICYFYICVYPQLSWKGRVETVDEEIRLLTEVIKEATEVFVSKFISTFVLKVSCKHFIDPGTASSYSLQGMQHYLAYLMFGLTHASYELHSALLFFLIVSPVLFLSGL